MKKMRLIIYVFFCLFVCSSEASAITVTDIDKNSVIYIYRNNSLSYVDDICITDNVSMNGQKYYYAKNVTLGDQQSNKRVALKANSNTTIDASGDVYLNNCLVLI